MEYMGSKRRLAKWIIPILTGLKKEGQTYVEPFVGGANLIMHMDGKRLGLDNNKYLIALLKAVSNGWVPPDNVSVYEYKAIMENKDYYPQELVGFVGFCCSFGSKFFAGYARNNYGRNYAEAGKRSLLKQAPYLKGIEFICQDYSLTNYKDCLIYCDPPYYSTTKYHSKFNNSAFWQWAKEQSGDNTLLVSEYTAPSEWECIMEVTQTCHINSFSTPHRKVEKLFKLK